FIIKYGLKSCFFNYFLQQIVLFRGKQQVNKPHHHRQQVWLRYILVMFRLPLVKQLPQQLQFLQRLRLTRS
ncbi:MAG TPA: hypothetical protein PLN45_05590, partial [Exilispira sp.]|nr:hypothetical protein [Exilispira sp.]